MGHCPSVTARRGRRASHRVWVFAPAAHEHVRAVVSSSHASQPLVVRCSQSFVSSLKKDRSSSSTQLPHNTAINSESDVNCVSRDIGCTLTQPCCWKSLVDLDCTRINQARRSQTLKEKKLCFFRIFPHLGALERTLRWYFMHEQPTYPCIIQEGTKAQREC